MNDSVDSFVRKLHDEGVRAGREEAERIIDTARTEARRIVESAHSRAEEIEQKARLESEKLKTQASREMALAARDVVLALQTAVQDVIERIIAKEAARPLSDPNFIVQTLHDIIREYASSDARRVGLIEVDVREEIADSVSKDLTNLLATTFADRNAPSLDVRGRLEKYGFEYQLDEGTVEVSAQSMAALLATYVGRELRPIFKDIQARFQPTAQGDQKPHEAIRV